MEGKIVHLNPLVVENLQWVEQGERVLMGTTRIAGKDFHVLAVEVIDRNGVQEAVRDSYGHYSNILAFNEERLETIQIPGFTGEFVLAIFPFA